MHVYYVKGYKGGTIDTESEPLCGKASVQNPGRLYHGDEIDVSFGGHVSYMLYLTKW